MSSINFSEDDKKNQIIINSAENEKSKEQKTNNDENQLKNQDYGFTSFSAAVQDPKNYESVKTIVSAFFNYQLDSLKDIERMERDFKLIGEKYTKRLPFNYKERLEKLKNAIAQNYSFLVKIASPFSSLFKIIKYPSGETYLERLTVPPYETVSIKSNLRLFVRDWSEEGAEERNQAYNPILEEIKSYFKNKTKKDYQNGIKVLVPGAGLGRLMFEIAKLGFKVEGNEFSFNMLLFYNYFFSSSPPKKNEITIQPFIHILSNLLNFETAFKKVMIPDVDIKEELSKTDTGSLYMLGGDFCAAYKDKINNFDCVATCFFIDTAFNIVEYIETIYNTLKTDGLWINIGPLLYHHTSDINAISIELGWNEIKEVIKGYGFEFTKEEIIETTYSTDKDCMIKKVYRCIFFTAIKKEIKN